MFDPTSFFLPTLLHGKALLYQTWEGECKELLWDSPLPKSLYGDIVQFVKSLYELEEIEFPRNLWPQDAIEGRLELTIFSIGSVKVFGAVVYIRWSLAA